MGVARQPFAAVDVLVSKGPFDTSPRRKLPHQIAVQFLPRRLRLGNWLPRLFAAAVQFFRSDEGVDASRSQVYANPITGSKQR